jgi:hypothetical protein
MEILETAKNMLVVKNNNKTTLFSYNQKIATYNTATGLLCLTDLWDYSQTTLKQLKHFINNHTKYTYTTKKEFETITQKNNNILIA